MWHVSNKQNKSFLGNMHINWGIFDTGHCGSQKFIFVQNATGQILGKKICKDASFDSRVPWVVDWGMYQWSIQVQIQLHLGISVNQWLRQSKGEYEPLSSPSLTVFLLLCHCSSDSEKCKNSECVLPLVLSGDKTWCKQTLDRNAYRPCDF